MTTPKHDTMTDTRLCERTNRGLNFINTYTAAHNNFGKNPNHTFLDPNMLQQDMIQHDHTFLFQARKAEKNPTVREGILAVSLHLNQNMPVVDMAGTMGCDRQSVYNWIARYEEHGIEGLADRPRPGRPPKIKLGRIRALIAETAGITTPKQIMSTIRKRFGISYSRTTVKRILRRLGMSYKKSKSIHVNRPEIDKIKQWQKETKRHILRLKRQDYTILQQDECMVHADDNAGYRN